MKAYKQLFNILRTQPRYNPLDLQFKKEIMNLVLNSKEFKHLPERSVYNDNYYFHTENDYVINEVCNEDLNYYEFYLIENGNKIYLGCTFNGFSEDIIDMEFKKVYT